ncbi:MAG: hypothetical protein QOJ34_895, partial [Pseudonocardiales bacterium]|nr:hypothetical protein [Pseudonocardiales bacterium]
GSATHGWTLTWSSAPSTPAHRAFDVQIKRPGSQTFVAFKTRTAQLQANFNPAKNGKYQFRARTINTSNGKHSDWSSPVTLTIS